MLIKYIPAVILLIFLLMIPADSSALIDKEGVTFYPQQTVGVTEMVLKGTGIIRYMGIFKVSVAGFYLTEQTPAALALSDTPRRLEIEYRYAIKKEDFAESTLTWIKKNVDQNTFETLMPRIRQLNALYEDVEPGDRYCLTYIPGQGTHLSLNGIRKGTVEGAAFSSALFSIWIGRTPLTERLRSELLGLR